MAKDKTSTPDKPKRPRFESRYDPIRLRELINQGVLASDIMTELGIKHRQTLKQYVLRLISEDKQFYELRGLYLKDSRRPRVSRKLEVRINLKNIGVHNLDVKYGDEFLVSAEDNRIILTKI